MKRQCLVTMLACLFLSMSSHQNLYGAEEIAAKAFQESAATALKEAGVKGSEDAMLKMTTDLATSMQKSASKILGDTVLKDSTALMKSLEESATKTLKESITTFGNDTSKLADHINSGDFTTSMTNNFIKQQYDIGAMAALDRTSSLTDRTSSVSDSEFVDAASNPPLTSAQEAEIKGMSKDAQKAYSKMSPGEQENFFKDGSVAGKNERVSWAKNVDEQVAKKEASSLIPKWLKNIGETSVEDVKIGLKSGVGKIIGVTEIIGMAVLFMIPSIFESAFLAEQQRNALLMTYSAPIKFGNIVLQIPDSEINTEEPSMTDFIYYGIPVDVEGAPLSKSAASMYPGVTGPDKNNQISKSITSGYAKLFSLGTAKTTPPPARYNLDSSALSTLPIFVSYSENSWDTWGASAINDPSFGQMLINLNTGFVFYADGLSDSTPAAPLVDTGAVKSVQSYLSTKLGKLSTAGTASTYTEYTDTFSSSKASQTSSPITNQFNCACLKKNNGQLSADTIASCSASCLLVPALTSLSSGMIINASGKPLTKDQSLATEIAQGALGQVIPIQGLGDTFDDYLSFFPGAESDAISSSNLTVSYGFLDASGSTKSNKPKVEGALPDNYAAQGVYVYQCKNTPFAKMLRSQAGGANTTGYNDHINDFIVFFDHELNQIPLMVPMEDPLHFNFPVMQMNPDIEYFSTIIGNTDSQGNFVYLDQLKVVPGKNQPAIIPLYGLQAQNGFFKLNGNAQLLAKLDGIVKSLESHSDLGEQFKATRNAMLQLTLQGPFGKYNLRPVPSTTDSLNMTPVIGGIKMPVYNGFNTYPVPQGTYDTANYNDILIPVGANGSTAVLPSSTVIGYYGIVSDLSYSVASDGSLYVALTSVAADGSLTIDVSKGYARSCFSQTVDSTGQQIWKIDDTKASSYYWLTVLTNMAKAPMPQALIDSVYASRAAWIAWVKQTNTSPISNIEMTGITLTGSGLGSRKDSVLKIVGQQALVNGLYVYTCLPNPSKLAQDFFVLTNSQNPLESDATLGTMSASKATTKTNMLSLVSGILYSSSGAPIKNSLGIVYQIDPMTLVNSLYNKNAAGFSDDFTSAVVTACNNYKKAEGTFVYPFEFYNLKLGMYQADIDLCSYIYGDAFGAGTSTDFKPKDYFVTYDDKNGVTLNQQLSDDASQCIVSLVSGIVYSKVAAVHTLSPTSLTGLYASVSKSLRSSLAADIVIAQKAFAAQQAANSKTDQQTITDTSTTVGITWKPADVVAKIAAVASVAYLPAQYVMLKQDPTSQQYVQISPASTDGTDFLYTFFDVPYQDGKGGTLHVGGMFDSKGNQLYLFGDLQLESSLIQNGISIANGKQMLGVPALQPIMLLDKADITLNPGISGKSMIHATDQNFPSRGISSPIKYQDRTSYFYYNTVMKAYYVMEVHNNDVRYISMAGGNIYNQDGSYRPSLNPVALKNGTDVTDILLAYLNENSYTQCVMMNTQNKGLYQNFTNIENAFGGKLSDGSLQPNVKLADGSPVAANLVVAATDPYTQVTVVQAPRIGTIPPMPDIHDANQYSVYWNTNIPTMYKVDPNYAWQTLMLLPINMKDVNRSILNPMPSASFNAAGIVLKKGIVDRMVFANNLYAVASSSGTSYTMKQVSNSSAPAIVVTLKKDPITYVKDLKTGLADPTTGVSYYEVVVGSAKYNYQIVVDVLSDEQLTSYQYNAWQSETVADVKANIILTQFLPGAGSGSLQIQSVGIASVANVPADPGVQATLTKNLARVKFDGVHGRFVATIFAAGGSDDQAPFYDYFNQNGYVDLETGALFDSNGIPAGLALKMIDLMALSNKLSVVVTRDDKKVASLLYKSSSRSNPAALGGTAISKTQSQSGVLGRLGSDQNDHAASGFSGWMSSCLSRLGGMIFGN